MRGSGHIPPPDITGVISPKPAHPPRYTYNVPHNTAVTGRTKRLLGGRHALRAARPATFPTVSAVSWGMLYVYLGGWMGGFGDITPVISFQFVQCRMILENINFAHIIIISVILYF